MEPRNTVLMILRVGRVAKEANDKELISRTYKQLMQLNNEKKKQPNQRVGRDLNRHVSKEDIQMANKYIKRCPKSKSDIS